ASVGLGFFARSAEAAMIWPAWQYPHCGTSSSIHARCTGCDPLGDSPSIVVTAAFPTLETGVWQDRVATPLSCTVHAPHCATPQPYLVPGRSSTSRRTHRRGMSGGTSTVADFPLTLRVYFMAGGSVRAGSTIHSEHA